MQTNGDFIMTTKLERNWWFLLPVTGLAAALTAYLMDSAGLARPYTVAQWVLYGVCFGGLQRGFSFVGWLLVLFLSPSSKALERTR
jgi:hypothetical protein